SSHYPSGYEADAWAATAVLAAGAIAFYALARRELDGRAATAAGIAAVAFDTAIVSVFVLIYNFEPGTPTRQLLFLPLVEAAVRFQLVGGLAVAVASAPVAAEYEKLRVDRFHNGYHGDFVTFQLGLELLMALIVGWLVRRLAR